MVIPLFGGVAAKPTGWSGDASDGGFAMDEPFTTVPTYLVTWNPKKFNWVDFDSCYEEGLYIGNWSCGNTKRIQAGDRIFMIRQGC